MNENEPSEIQLDPAYVDRLEGSGGPLAAAFDHSKREPSAPEPTERTAWLHGWTWWPGHVEINIGTAFYCVGCGKFFGTGAVVFEEGWEAPGPEPDWPFPEEGCPLCALRGKDSDLHDKVSRYESVLYAHGIPLSTMPSQPLSKAQREAIRRNLP